MDEEEVLNEQEDLNSNGLSQVGAGLQAAYGALSGEANNDGANNDDDDDDDNDDNDEKDNGGKGSGSGAGKLGAGAQAGGNAKGKNSKAGAESIANAAKKGGDAAKNGTDAAKDLAKSGGDPKAAALGPAKKAIDQIQSFIGKSPEKDLAPHEKSAVNAIGKGVSALSAPANAIPYAGPAISAALKTVGESYPIAAELAPDTLFRKPVKIITWATIGPPLIIFLFFFLISAIFLGFIMSVGASAAAGSSKQMASDAPISPALDGASYYGVRVFYENNELANRQLEATYNQLTFEFLKTLSEKELEGIESINITIPEDIYAEDISEFKTELTNSLVYKIAENVLETDPTPQGEDPIGDITVTAENFEEYLSQIAHFGFIKDNFNEIIKGDENYFIDILIKGIKTSLEDADDTNNLVTFKDGTSELPADFKDSLIAIWEDAKFNSFKISTEKIFVKDLIFDQNVTEENIDDEIATILDEEDSENSSSKNSPKLEIDGTIIKYIYMSKENTEIKQKSYGMGVEENSQYKIAFGKVTGGEFSELHSAVADSSWVTSGADEAEEAQGTYAEGFIDADSDYYSTTLDFNGPYTCTDFTALDKENLEYLAQENLTLFSAIKQNLNSAKLCFTLTEEDGYTTLTEYNPNCDYYCVTFEDATENQTSTGFTFNDIF